MRRTKPSTVPYSVLGGLSQWYVATSVADDHGVVSNGVGETKVDDVKGEKPADWHCQTIVER